MLKNFRENVQAFVPMHGILTVAVLALAIPIALIALPTARSVSQSAICASHLRDIGRAYERYRAAHGRYPEPWTFVSGSQVSDRRILFCPADRTRAPLGVASSYLLRYAAPPEFRPLAEVPAVDPRTVLAACDHHAGRGSRDAARGGGRWRRLFPRYHLVLRASGVVERIPVRRVRAVVVARAGRLKLSDDRPTFMHVYPGEPGYERTGSDAVSPREAAHERSGSDAVSPMGAPDRVGVRARPAAVRFLVAGLLFEVSLLAGLLVAPLVAGWQVEDGGGEDPRALLVEWRRSRYDPGSDPPLGTAAPPLRLRTHEGSLFPAAGLRGHRVALLFARDGAG